MNPLLFRLLPYGLLVAAITWFTWSYDQRGDLLDSTKSKLRDTEAELVTKSNQLVEYRARVQAVNRQAEEYRKAASKVHVITEEIIREVPTLVPVDACPLPDGWRVLHNAAASGSTAATGADGARTASTQADR